MTAKNSDGFQSYTPSIGKNAAPLEKVMEVLTEDEHNMLAPLETTIYVPTVEEIYEILKNYIGEELYKEIFA